MTSALSSAANTLSSLLKQSSIDDHEQLLKAADAALKTSKNDVEAQHVKVVALLNLDRFDDALRVLETGGDPIKERARLEWAYALYKTGNPAKAAEVAHDGQGRGMRHVEAQASYRNEDFQKASELYAAMASQTAEVENEDVDLKINNGAVDAQLEWANMGHLVKNKKPGREDLAAFETAYNAACGSIARGELGQAEVLLKRSKDLCNALDDLSENDKQAELLPITVQQIYVLTRLGRLGEAERLASSIGGQDLSDSASKHIAKINTIATSAQPENPYTAQRLIQASPDAFKPDKPFGYQSNVMRRNDYAVALLSQKFEGTIESTKSVIASKPSPNFDPTIASLSAINAAAHARNESGKNALKLVLPELEKRPTDVGLLLVVTQLYVLSGNFDAATILVEKFLGRLEESSEAGSRYAPALIATLTSLYSARGQTQHSQRELAKAAKHWRQETKSISAPLPRSVAHLLKTAGASLLDSDEPSHAELARDIFTSLHSADSSDRYTSAGMIAALAATDPSSITSEQLSSLTPVDRLLTGIDVSALENAGVAKTAPLTAPVSAKRSAPSQSAPKKSKKIKPSRMPKDYDPNKKPDPERWLPLRDRSSYRPKGKKGKNKANMFSQGAVDDSRPATPSQVEKSTVVGGGKQPQQKKKKGKGGKW